MNNNLLLERMTQSKELINHIPSQLVNEKEGSGFEPSLQSSREQKKIVRWVCELCGVLSFKTYSECYEHEKTCSGNVSCHNKSYHQGEKRQSFSQKKQEINSADFCKEVPMESDTSNPAASMWVCSHCNCACFESYSDALAHEETCLKNSTRCKNFDHKKPPSPKQLDELPKDAFYECSNPSVLELPPFKPKILPNPVILLYLSQQSEMSRKMLSNVGIPLSLLSSVSSLSSPPPQQVPPLSSLTTLPVAVATEKQVRAENDMLPIDDKSHCRITHEGSTHISNCLTNEDQWVCEYCKKAVFNSYEDAVLHEKSCESRKSLFMDLDDEQIKATKHTESTINQDSSQDISHVLLSLSKPASSSLSSKSKKSTGFQNTQQNEVWVCSVCKTKKFDTYAEACAHEVCCGKSNETKRKKRMLPLSSSESLSFAILNSGQDKNMPFRSKKSKTSSGDKAVLHQDNRTTMLSNLNICHPNNNRYRASSVFI